jgi:5-methyltetrahydropteroyltriglutamate--homocysteine methyltransferase
VIQAGKLDAEGLEKAAANVKASNWTSLAERGLNLIPWYSAMLRFIYGSAAHCSRSGDFSLYDHVLDHSFSFNVIPSHYHNQGLSNLDTYFSMARGRQSGDVDVQACEMKKWFVNHSYIPNRYG